MRRVRVDSFGPVHRNQQQVIPPGHEPRLDLYRRYKFTLAFEISLSVAQVSAGLRQLSFSPAKIGIFCTCIECKKSFPPFYKLSFLDVYGADHGTELRPHCHSLLRGHGAMGVLWMSRTAAKPKSR